MPAEQTAKRKGLGWKIGVAAGGRVHDLGQKVNVEVHMRIERRGETMEVGRGSSNLWVSLTPRKERLKGENPGARATVLWVWSAGWTL